jgi:thiol-disulfide isomerase/thioredoxin
MGSRTWSRAVVLGLAAVLAVAGWLRFATPAQRGNAMQPPFEKRLKVPTLPAGLKWLNTSGPIELSALRGKFVVLDFWTYCCINCMHTLPELKKLEHAYPDTLAVIGVHSAKFAAEQEADNITEAILRYQIEHPVINDANHAVWELFGINSWPTVLLIDPEGYVVWGTSGEVTFEQIDAVLKGAIPYYRNRKLLDTTPLHFDIVAAKSKPSPLRFPGKVLADEATGRLFIADSNHNRIVVAQLDGTLLAEIGAGTPGRADGDFATAQFNQPQGMALRGDELFVADTENHLIRRVDLAGKTVSTIAGTGRQARDPAPPGKMSDPMKTALSSPWDLWLDAGQLYIAMAGSHQIWHMRLDKPAIGPYAGNGREDIVDGPLLPKQAYAAGSSFAQPSGLASDGTWLYVADSEGSSIRAVPLRPGRDVRTVVGTSHLSVARLFTFGDVDGPAAKVRLQHPLGVAFAAGQIYVADTYNNKIKVLDPASGTTHTLTTSPAQGSAAATAAAGKSEPASLDEPAGLSAAGGKLFVADTNHHRIRVVDLKDSTVSTLTIAGLAPPKPPAEPDSAFALPDAAQVSVPPATVQPQNGQLHLTVELQLPAGYKINEEAPTSYLVDFPAAGAQPGPIVRDKLDKPITVAKPSTTFDIALPLNAQTGRDTVRISLNYFYCRTGAEGICKVGSVVWTVPLELKPDATTTAIPLRHQVE